MNTNRPLRIGMVCYPTYGGSGVVATELGKALAERGHSVHFISNTQPARLDVFRENLYFHEVNMVHYPLFEHSPYVLALTGKMVEVAREQNLDLFHVHYAIPHATAAHLAKEILAGQGKNIRVVTTLHGTDITLVGKDPNYSPVVSFAIQQSDVVTAVSEYLRRRLCGFLIAAKRSRSFLILWTCSASNLLLERDCGSVFVLPGIDCLSMYPISAGSNALIGFWNGTGL